METPNFERDNQRRFWNACLQLHYAGLGVSAQKVHAKVGGSLRDIQPIVTRFQEKAKQFAELETMPLPEELENRVHNTLRTVAVQIWSEARELASADVLRLQSEMAETKKTHELEIAELRSELDKWRKEAGKLDVDISDIKTENTSLKAQNEQLRDDLHAMKDQIRNLELALASANKDTLVAENRARENQAEASKATQEKLKMQTERNLLASRLSDLETKSINAIAGHEAIQSLRLELKYQSERATRLEEKLELAAQKQSGPVGFLAQRQRQRKVIHRKQLKN